MAPAMNQRSRRIARLRKFTSNPTRKKALNHVPPRLGSDSCTICRRLTMSFVQIIISGIVARFGSSERINRLSGKAPVSSRME